MGVLLVCDWIAVSAATAHRFDDLLEVVFAVVKGDLLAGSDTTLGFDKDRVLLVREFGISVRAAAVVDIAADVRAILPIEGPGVVQGEEIFAAASVGFFSRDLLAGVFDDLLILGVVARGEEPKPSATALDRYSIRSGGFVHGG